MKSVSRWILIGLVFWGGINESIGQESLILFSDQWMAKTGQQILRHKPSPIEIQHRSTNTLTAIQALIQGSAQAVLISRALDPGELRAFQQHHGNKPKAVPIGLDGVVILVPPDNPLRALTVAQIDAIFSEDRRCRFPAAIERWSQLQPNLSDRLAMRRYGMDPDSSPSRHLIAKGLCGGKLNSKVTLLSDPNQSLKLCRKPGGICYATLGQVSNLRLIPVAGHSNTKAVLPTPNNLQNGRYPLTFYVYLYYSEPSEAVSALVRWILSDQGQAFVATSVAPLPRPLREKMVRVNR